METQTHTCCKRNYTFFFLHFRGTNHIAGSRLSIGKAGVYSKEQDKKKKENGVMRNMNFALCSNNKYELVDVYNYLSQKVITVIST